MVVIIQKAKHVSGKKRSHRDRQSRKLEALSGSWMFILSAVGTTEGFLSAEIESDLHFPKIFGKNEGSRTQKRLHARHHYVATVSVKQKDAHNSHWNYSGGYDKWTFGTRQ